MAKKKNSNDITLVNDNYLIFNNLNKLTLATSFIEKLHELQNSSNLVIDLSNVKTIFLNAAVPVAGIMDYFKRNYNTHFQSVEPNLNLTKVTLFHPLQVHRQHG